jgi:hypothetical protein
MKKIIIYLTVLLFCNSAYGQWKAQSGETYGKTFKMAYVTSISGGETLRVIRNIPLSTQKNATDPYDQVTGQILLNKNIGSDYRVQSLVFRFDDSPVIYVHQPADLKQKWDNNTRKYTIESDWALWRIDDLRDKESREIITDQESIPEDRRIYAKDIIQLLKSKKKLLCQIVMIDKSYGSQSMISAEFSLTNSTKSVNYLFQ